MEATFRSGATVLGKYRIDSVTGRVGMYVVLRVSSPQLGGDLVLKMLLPESSTSLAVHARFVREAQAAARLRDEHAARLIDVGISSDGVPYLVTEPVRGVELAAELARRGALLPEEAADYAVQICNALSEAHALGIAHRNLTSDSVLLTARPDGTALVKLLDFGLAEPSGDDADGRGDLRALGAVLHECLTGRRPFPVDAPPAARAAAIDALPPLDPRIPEGLRHAVLRCLDDRQTGFASAAALAAALAPYAHDPRTAGYLVERAHQLAHGVASAADLPPGPGGYPIVAAAGPAGAAPWPAAPPAPGRSARRYATIAAVALAASIGGISAAALIRPGRSRAPEPAPIALPSRDAPAEPAAVAPVVASPAAAPATAPAAPEAAPPAAIPPAPTTAAAAPPAPAAAPPAPAAAPASGPGPGDADRARKLAACADLQARKRWQALDDCAAELGKLGEVARAEQLRATARQEQQDEVLSQQADRALRDGNFKAAQATLEQIDPGSVYAAPLRDAFATAEQLQVDDARRKAQSLADAHDCAALRRLVARLRTTATEPILAAAAEVRCDDDGPERAAKPEPSERAAKPEPPAERSAPARQTGRARKDSCETLDVGELMTRAATEYDAGAAGTALSLTRVALGCKQTDRMYWLAVMYACAAHDAASAKLYFPKVPANLQSGIERKCQQDNLDVRTR